MSVPSQGKSGGCPRDQHRIVGGGEEEAIGHRTQICVNYTEFHNTALTGGNIMFN
ncbi:hypothetical protein IscW_ISCW002329 [Ixodes scapularis]|uniref:Uncharacterized protein n=1 Tax=Ixodes scapularis TaxID=6945 RepID=B7P9A0_IXOSC|nr:hypothetical protein IscW_ISCW002329 [Ixodes scapularis]|eukprot:XP_002403781.1 hypothetical protein IscW_ISCW002329 [Ixodes scapularis]